MDISKAYQSLHTGKKEADLRLFLWRKNPGNPWETYSYDRVNFGDLIAALCLELAKKWTAELGATIDEKASQLIIEAMYVDDFLGGGSSEEVDRMRGEKMVDDKGQVTYTGTMSEILSTTGFQAKAQVVSRRCTQEEAEALGDKALGVPYCAVKDEFNMKLQPCITVSRKRGAKVVTMLQEKDIVALEKGLESLTKRTVLSFLMGNFDPLGLLTPLIVRGKILLRRLYGPDCPVGWDDPLPKEEQDHWIDLLKLAVDMKPVNFPRSVRPEEAEGDAWLIGFGDGSLAAFASALYIRWRLRVPKTKPAYVVNLLMAKARVSPVHGTSTPRSEMQSLVMMMRLILTAVRALPFKIGRVVMALDSQCSIAATEKSGGILGPYFANRVSEYYRLRDEIEDLVGQVEPLQYIPGELNISADMCTRGKAGIGDILPGSSWQEGPSFLKLEREDWPLNRDFRSSSLPKEELRTKHEVLFSRSNLKENQDSAGTLKRLVTNNLAYHSSWDRSIAVLARVVRSLPNFNRSMSPSDRRALIRKDPGVDELEFARLLQIFFSQEESAKALQEGRLATLGGRVARGLVVVSGRVPEEDMGSILGKPYLPVVWASTRLARLIVRHCHQEDHRLTPTDIVARTRRFVWIPRCLSLAKSEATSCQYCRRRRKIMEVQIMGSLPKGQTLPTAPFLATCLDLFGPVICRGLGGGVRKPMKAYGVVFCCLSTKAVKILATTGYSTEQFLVCYLKFVGNQGAPAVVLSDHGSQLVSAARKLSDPGAKDIDWGRVVSLSSRSGTKWIFSEKGCPWRNGSAEATVKLAKETLAHQLQSQQSLDWSELDSTFCQVADIINNRPLGVFHSEEDYHQICPNDLLLGRTHRPSHLPDLVEEESVDVKKILSQREELVDRWWKEWQRKVFPTLIPRKKWHQQSRNVRPGDVVLIQYQGHVKTVWRLGKILEVFPDKHGVVRTCEVGYRQRHSGENTLPYRSKPLQTLRIAVQRLCVLLPVEEQDTTESDAAVSPTEEDVLLEECQVQAKAISRRVDDESWTLGEEDSVVFPQSRDEEEKPKKLSKKEKRESSKQLREPRRFSRRLAGFSAAINMALDLDYYLSAEEEDECPQ